MVNIKTIDFRINPYAQEALIQLLLDILIMVMISAVLIWAGFSYTVCLLTVIGYFVVSLFFHYRVIIQAKIDKRKGDYITEIIYIKQFIKEYSFAGDRMGNSNVRFFYPKEMDVNRYKMKVINSNGEEEKLRTVMSFRRLLNFSVLDGQGIEYLQVTYLKRSKVLLSVDLINEDKPITGKRKKRVDKAIHYINLSI